MFYRGVEVIANLFESVYAKYRETLQIRGA